MGNLPKYTKWNQNRSIRGPLVNIKGFHGYYLIKKLALFDKHSFEQYPILISAEALATVNLVCNNWQDEADELPTDDPTPAKRSRVQENAAGT